MSIELKAAQAALKSLVKPGVSDASAAAYTSKKSEFTIEGGRFTLLRTTLDHSLSLQAIREQRRGTFSGNSFEPKAIESAARDCLASAEAGQADSAWEMAKEGRGEFLSGIKEPDLDLLFERTRELLDSIHREYPKVVVEQLVSQHTGRSGVYVNSHGVQYESTAGAYSVTVMFSGHEGEKSSSFNYSGFGTEKLDRPFLDQGSLRQNLADAEKQIHTQQTEGKFEGTVIFTPDCLGGMLGELIGNYAADGVLLDGTSQWKDALDTQVADPAVTISLMPHDGRVINGERFTAEGFLSQDYDLIKDGVLKQFMLTAYGANKTGKKRAPNTSFSLIMKPGGKTLEELIAGTRKGLLVSRYSGGAAGAGGEFSGVAKNSFLIEGGRLGPAVSETMISGNLAGMLKNIAGISKETVEDGASSLPWVAVEGITISGK